MSYTFRVTGQVDDTRALLYTMLATSVTAEVAAASPAGATPPAVPPYERSSFSFAAIDADAAARSPTAAGAAAAAAAAYATTPPPAATATTATTATATSSHDVLGCCVGYSAWNELYLDLLAANAQRRVPGTGTALLHAVEQLARERGCDRVALFTLDFQARPFYEKRGFTLYATQTNYAGAHTRYCLEKLVPPLTASAASLTSPVVALAAATASSSASVSASPMSASPSSASPPTPYGTPTTRSPTAPVAVRVVASNYDDCHDKALEWIGADVRSKPHVSMPPVDESTVAVVALRHRPSSSSSRDGGGGGESEPVGGAVFKTMWGNVNVEVCALRHDVPFDEAAPPLLDYLERAARQRQAVRLMLSTISPRLGALCRARGFREYGRQDGLPHGYTLVHLEMMLKSTEPPLPQPHE